MSENNQVEVATRQTPVASKWGKAAVVGTVGAGAMVASSLSSAVGGAGLDVTALTGSIDANGTSMQTVMMAVLTLVALFVGYRMIKRSMS